MGDLNLLRVRDKAIWSRLFNIVDMTLLKPTTMQGHQQSPFTYYRHGYRSALDRCLVSSLPLDYSHLNIQSVHFSDHMALVLTLSSVPFVYNTVGSSFRDFHSWQPPVTLLHSEEFHNIVSEAVKTVETDFCMLSSEAKWSLLKLHLKYESFYLYMHFKTVNRNKLSVASASLVSELSKVDPDIHEVLTLKATVHQLRVKQLTYSFDKLKTATIRNREQPTKFLFRNLKQRRQMNTISSLQHPINSSEVITEKKEMTMVLASAYSKRFANRSESTFQEHFSPLLHHSASNLSKLQIHYPMEFDKLNADISRNEIEEAITLHPGSSSAGPDGLGGPFYKLFFHLFMPFLLSFFHCIADINLLTNTSFQAVTALLVPIPKGRGSSHPSLKGSSSINDFRAIATINYDLRILARILNKRLGAVMHHILHPHIFAIRGRNINHSSLLHFVATRNLTSTSRFAPHIIKADLTNAFDMTSICILMNHFVTLFGVHITTRLLFFILISRRLKVKLFTSCSFTITMHNGLLQGCPLSSSLYSIYMNPLMLNVNRHINGLPLGSSGISVKASSFVDDLIIGCRDFPDVQAAFASLRSFQNRTGSIINMKKTFSFRLKIPSTRHDRSFSSRNSSNSMDQQILGHFILPSQVKQRRKQRSEFLQYFVQFVDRNKFRSLSILARVRIVNTMLISRVSYHCLFMPFPATWIKSFYAIARTFIWTNMAHVGIAKLFLPRAFGGLGLVNLKLYLVLRRLRFMFSIRDAFYHQPHLANFLQSSYASIMRISDNLLLSLSSLIGSPIDHNTNLRYGNFVFLMCSTHQFRALPRSYLSMIHSLYLRPGLFNFTFYLLHSCLPVSSYLHHVRHMSAISEACPLCRSSPETLVHLFTECPRVIPIIEPFLQEVNISLASFLVCLSDFTWPGLGIKHIKLLLTLAFAIWKYRCYVLFRRGDDSFSSISHHYNRLFIMDRLQLPSYIFDSIW